jgi:hypothetical protein
MNKGLNEPEIGDYDFPRPAQPKTEADIARIESEGYATPTPETQVELARLNAMSKAEFDTYWASLPSTIARRKRHEEICAAIRGQR